MSSLCLSPGITHGVTARHKEGISSQTFSRNRPLQCPSRAPQAGHALFIGSFPYPSAAVLLLPALRIPVPRAVPAKRDRERARDIGNSCPAPGSAHSPSITLHSFLSLHDTHLELGSHVHKALRPSGGTRAMKSAVLQPGFQLGFATVLFKVWRNGNCARWPLTGAPGFTWCKAVLLEGEAANCCQEYFLWISWASPAPCGSDKKGSGNSMCLGGTRTSEH